VSLVAHFRAMALNNAWSNARLHAACARLTPEELAAPRTSFFPSIRLTLNHVVLVDRYYLDAVEGGGGPYAARFADPEPYRGMAELSAAQAAEDRRLAALCDGLGSDADLARPVALDRGPRGILPDALGPVLAHLFVHQVHHRGQVHAMLAGTRVPPPQLDEFFLAEDAAVRDRELAAIGLAPPAVR
jgi:uncharacterized damage-inducible protein DinB